MRLLTLEHDLRQALQGNQLFLHYQPQVEIASGRPIGVEALLRWSHPRDGLIMPNAFIPTAEESGLIQEIGTWVLWTVLMQIQTWERAGLPPLPVAVNLSALQFRRGQQHQALGEEIARMLRDTAVSPSRLELEITENSLMEDIEETRATLHRLHELGLRLALDDFGTGYSSLSYLKHLPLDRLKIDQSFVRDIAVKREDAAIADTIITLARNLGFEVMAEGVETQAQLRKLRDTGCRQAQGYYFSHPLPPEEVQAWLKRAA